MGRRNLVFFLLNPDFFQTATLKESKVDILWSKFLARAVQKVGNATHRISHYPANSVICFVNCYPLDSDLSGG